MFLQRDPIGFSSGDLNLYAYVENNPFNWSDPSGLSPSVGNLVTTAGAIAVSRSLFGAIWRLTNLIVTAMAIDNLKNPPDNPPDNPPVPDTADCDPAKNPKGCDKPKECPSPTVHADDRLAESGNENWNRIYEEGQRFVDDETGYLVRWFNGQALVVDPATNEVVTYLSNITRKNLNKRISRGKWQHCS
jgi:hypothetical protein